LTHFVTNCVQSKVSYRALSDQRWLLRQDNDVYLGNFPR